jgi:hypothetical protein
MPDVLPHVCERVCGGVGGGARLLSQTRAPARYADASRVPDGVVEQPEAPCDLVLGPRGEPVIGHDAELRIAIAVGQRLAERQAEPRPGRAERVGDDHRDRVGGAAGGAGIELLDGEPVEAAAKLVEALVQHLAERGDRRVSVGHRAARLPAGRRCPQGPG